MKAFWGSNAVLDLSLAGRESALAPLRDALPLALATRWVDGTPEWKPWRDGLDVLARRFGARLNAGTNDLLHLVAAEQSGCDAFVSLDVHSGLRSMAHALGFRVYPALDSLPVKDSPLLRKLKF